jgi:hypothetical protein
MFRWSNRTHHSITCTYSGWKWKDVNHQAGHVEAQHQVVLG